MELYINNLRFCSPKHSDIPISKYHMTGRHVLTAATLGLVSILGLNSIGGHRLLIVTVSLVRDSDQPPGPCCLKPQFIGGGVVINVSS